jgi:hypothetical protein
MSCRTPYSPDMPPLPRLAADAITVSRADKEQDGAKSKARSQVNPEQVLGAPVLAFGLGADPFFGSANEPSLRMTGTDPRSNSA